MSQLLVYLLDVEGTVSPISLVYEQLFPYARKHLLDYLHQHAGEAETGADLTLLLKENLGETDPDTPRFVSLERIDQAGDYLLWLMDRDRKSTALKSLEGRVWKAGFEAGELVGTVFPDVPEAFRRWTGNGARVAIYSSGSVEAQRLLFRYSSAGDLTALISGYFDTRVGPKREARSYRTIAAELGVAPGEVMFVSDVVAELDAAREASLETRLAVRAGNAPVGSKNGHGVVISFEEL